MSAAEWAGSIALGISLANSVVLALVIRAIA